MQDNSVDVVVTDPPYFLDKLDDSWDSKEVASQKNMGVVTSLPSGMRFDKNQGKRFYTWYNEISSHLLRVLKPGGFFWSFSSPRLYHNMTSAIEDAGFLIKDQFMWLYTQSQPKAMSLDHVIKRTNLPEDEKASLIRHLSGWKTPQVKSCHEPICLAQKPLDGSFLANYVEHNVGLLDTTLRLGEDKFPANVVTSGEFGDGIDRHFLVAKPTKIEKGEYNTHKTVKPLEVCRYLIALSCREGALVLDPFCGSGSVCVAAKQLNRQYIGIDINEEYVRIANRRLQGGQDVLDGSS